MNGVGYSTFGARLIGYRHSTVHIYTFCQSILYVSTQNNQSIYVDKRHLYSTTRQPQATEPVQIGIVGGGISGLSLCHYISRYAATYQLNVQCTVLESSTRCGGWIQTTHTHTSVQPTTHTSINTNTNTDNAFTDTETPHDSTDRYYNDHRTNHTWLFENGPHSMLPRRGDRMLQLIAELNLHHDVICADASSKKRWIWYNNKLLQLPTTVIEAIRFPLITAILSGIYNDVRYGNRHKLISNAKASKQVDDLSIYDFIAQRFNSTIARVLVDPLVGGIYGGSIEKLSIRSCFPSLYRAYRDYGSVIRGVFRSKQIPHADDLETTFDTYQQQWLTSLKSSQSIFTLKHGLHTLIDRLCTQLTAKYKVRILTSQHVQSIRFNEALSSIVATDKHTQTTIHNFDHIISTLPADKLPSILNQSIVQADAVHDSVSQPQSALQSLVELYQSIQPSSIWMVHVGYQQSQLVPIGGFGFLVPTNDDLTILGITFDSSTFPDQDNGAQTRLSVFIGGDRYSHMIDYTKQQVTDIAIDAIHRTLRISQKPQYVNAVLNKNCIPQYYVGHHKTVSSIDAMQQQFNGSFKVNQMRLHLIGTGNQNVALNDCVSNAHDAAKQLCMSLRRKMSMK